MSKIISLNLRDNIKEKSYISQLLLTLVIYSLVFLQVVPAMQFKSNVQNIGFVMQYMFFIMGLSIFSTMLAIVISNICIREKVCNRIELYLANGVAIQKLFCSYSISTFILSALGVLLFDTVTSIFFVATNNILAINSLLNLKMLLFFVSLLLFCFAISLLLNALVLLMKDMSMIRTVTLLSSFIFIFGGSYLLKPLLKLGLHIDFIVLSTIVIFVFSMIIFLISFYMSRKLSSEKIILSLKQ